MPLSADCHALVASVKNAERNRESWNIELILLAHSQRSRLVLSMVTFRLQDQDDALTPRDSVRAKLSSCAASLGPK